MFLNTLSPAQQRAFLLAARAVAEADGTVPEIEQALLEGLQMECGYDEDPGRLPIGETLRAAEEALDSPAARNVFLMELAGVAVVDGIVVDEERELLGTFADRLGHSDAQLEEILEFAEDARTLVERGRTLVASSVGGA